MSIDNLPPELLARVVNFLALQENHLASYATLSRAWQEAIEKHTFAELSFSSTELTRFEKAVVTSSFTHRRAILRRVNFSIVLPFYNDNACGRFERVPDQRINNEAFSQAVAELFSALRNLEIAGEGRSIHLLLQHFYSPMDVDRRGNEKLSADRHAYEINKRKDLFQHRYENSYLSLLRPDKLPTLDMVGSLMIDGDGPRKLEPTVTAVLVSKLPNLVSVEWLLSDMERKRADLRTELRSDFAERLRSLDMRSLETFKLTLLHTDPYNEAFENADVRGQNSSLGDSLSAALRKFTQAQKLTEVILRGPICVGSNIFWPEIEGDEELKWCVMQYMTITLSSVRPDGGWYIDRDPHRDRVINYDDDNDDEDEVEYDSDVISDTTSGYDSSESFFANDELPPDEYGYVEERRDDRLNGLEPVRLFRTWPNSELEKVFYAAARAVVRMPELQAMSVGLDIDMVNRGCHPSARIGFDYLVPGTKHERDVEPSDEEHSRLYWDGPKGWRVSEALENQWKQTLGKDGIVRYNEW